MLIIVPLDSVMPRPESRITGLFWMINIVFLIDALLVCMRFKVRRGHRHHHRARRRRPPRP